MNATIKETSDGFDLNVTGGTPLNQIQFNLLSGEFCAAGPGQVCLGNHAIVNLGVTGYAYLLEPPAYIDVSDRIGIVFLSSGIAGSNLIQVTITLDSDPFKNNITSNLLASLNESGELQDVSFSIFSVASDPTKPGKTVLASGGFPFHVVLKSDKEVPSPEPSSIVFIATGSLEPSRLQPRARFAY
jgi:hypothetical protein